MSEICGTCMYKEESLPYINPDLLQVLYKLLETCNHIENIRHMLTGSMKACHSCQQKLQDMCNFRNMAVMSLDVMNNMQQDPTKGQYTRVYVDQSVLPTQSSSYITLSNAETQYGQPIQTDVMHDQVDLAEYVTFKSSNNNFTQPTQEVVPENMLCVNAPKKIKYTEKKEPKKQPDVRVVPPPELLGPNLNSSEHDYSERVSEEDDDVNIHKVLERTQQWYIRTLTDAEKLARMETKRRAPDFTAAPYRCDSCVIVFRDSAQLKEHITGTHNVSKGNFSCFLCSSRFRSLASLNRHVSLHVSFVYVCAICDFDTHDKRRILTHICTNRPKPKASNPKITVKTVHKCQICDKIFKMEKTLRVHMDTFHSEQCYPPEYHKCPECPARFKHLSSVEVHRRQKHAGAVDNRFSCDKCSMKFYYEKLLKHHKSTVHAKQKKYKCTTCNKGFVGTRGLRKHMIMCPKTKEKAASSESKSEVNAPKTDCEEKVEYKDVPTLAMLLKDTS